MRWAVSLARCNKRNDRYLLSPADEPSCLSGILLGSSYSTKQKYKSKLKATLLTFRISARRCPARSACSWPKVVSPCWSSSSPPTFLYCPETQTWAEARHDIIRLTMTNENHLLCWTIRRGDCDWVSAFSGLDFLKKSGICPWIGRVILWSVPRTPCRVPFMIPRPS